MRSTLNGFCAASGKLGATVGTAIFKPLKVHAGLGGTLLVCALVSLWGLVVTWFFVEDLRGKDMEEAEDEAEDERPRKQALR